MKKNLFKSLEWNHTVTEHKDGSITVKMLGPKDTQYVSSPAYTLDPQEVKEDAKYEDANNDKIHSRTHADGWTIKGVISEDYYMWVNDFEATKEDGSFVRGNFEDKIEASSVEALKDFLKNHTPSFWDYWDI